MPSELLLETRNNAVRKCRLFLGLQKANMQLIFVGTTDNTFLMIINNPKHFVHGLFFHVLFMC